MSWGGAREGAGRPARGPVPSEPHKTRPLLSARHPVHVTARFASRSTRRASRARAIRRALRRSLGRADFRIVHLVVLPTRLELIVEADDKVALARGMQGFQVSAARAINRQAGRHGAVFADRYRMAILRTRAAVRGAVGRLPLARRVAWPASWLLRVEGARASADRRVGAARRWIRTRADEDS